MGRLIKPALIVLGICLTMASCGHGAQHSSEQTLRRGLSGEPSTLDPAAAVDNFSIQILSDLYEGLTAESPSGDIAPAAASSWEVSTNGLEYRFHIRQGAKWSNGAPVKARDFLSAWMRVLNPKFGFPAADNLRAIKGASAVIAGKAAPDSIGVSAVDDFNLVVELEMPTPYFPLLVAQSASFPIFSDLAAKTHVAAQMVTNGPYVMSSWRSGTEVELQKNKEYWDFANVRTSKVKYLFQSNGAAQYSAYRSGEIDITDSVPANALSDIRKNYASELFVAPFLATAYYGLNFRSNALGINQSLRKSLSMAIDRERIVASLGFGQPPAYGLLPPGTWNYTNQVVDWKTVGNEQRINEAKKLFIESGTANGPTLRLRVLYNADPVIKRTAIMIAAMWKETLGIDVVLTEQEFRAFLNSRHDTESWDVIRLGWTADFNDASNFLDAFRKESPSNDLGYSNAEFDALLVKASVIVDPVVRRETLEAAERLLNSDYAIIPLYHYVSKRLAKPYILGIRATPLDHVLSKNLSVESRN